jgi:hypothetical protein
MVHDRCNLLLTERPVGYKRSQTLSESLCISGTDLFDVGADFVPMSLHFLYALTGWSKRRVRDMSICLNLNWCSLNW